MFNVCELCNEEGLHTGRHCNECELTILRNEKAERDNPQPLTIEQLKERVGKPVWCKVEDCSWIPQGGYWCLVVEGGVLAPSKNIVNFECAWRFYDHEPKGV